MSQMLAVFKSSEAVIVCRVDSDGKPIGADQYFAPGAFDKDNFEMDLVEAPVCIERGCLKVESERILT